MWMVPWVLASVSGLVQISLFPRFSCFFFAWIMLVPLLWALERSRPWKGFFVSLYFGLLSAAGVAYWLYHAVTGYFRVSPWIALPLMLSIHLLTAAVYFGLFGLAASALRKHFQSLYALLWLPSLWVVCEWLRARMATRDPWMLLGYSQHEQLGLIQIADLTGVYGVSFLIVMMNVGLYQILSHFVAIPRGCGRLRRRLLLWRTLIPTLALAGAWLYGHARLEQFRTGAGCDPHSAAPCVRVAVVQANVPSQFRWKSIFHGKTLEIYLRASLPALADPDLDLLVWPENALHFHPDREPLYLRFITSALRRGHAALVTGAPRMEQGPAGEERFHNSVFLITASGIRQVYDKIALLPLSEDKDLWPFRLLGPHGEAPSQFVAGRDPVVFDGPAGKFSTPICFEMIYPEHVRRFVRAGATYLLNLSNDSWFGVTAGPPQHLIYSVFRAIENRRHVVRATSTGISAFVEPTGEISQHSALNEAAVLSGRVRPLEVRTAYAAWGDAFVGLCLAIVAGGLLLVRRKGALVSS
ncbi:MAG: apolipoprotein N-acyltransferase [bacterium]